MKCCIVFMENRKLEAIWIQLIFKCFIRIRVIRRQMIKQRFELESKIQ